MQVCHYCLLRQTTLLEDHSMRLWKWAFEWVVSNTGAFLRTILSPTVFTFYYEFRYNLESTTDDSAIFWCMEGTGGGVQNLAWPLFYEWCGENRLQINVAKTKGLMVNFRKKRTAPNLICIFLGYCCSVQAFECHMAILQWTTRDVYSKGNNQPYFGGINE